MFTEEAERAMAELPADLLTFIEARLEEFAAGPRAAGARPTPSPPFVPGGMIVQFKREFISREQPACFLTVHFRYGRDETTIHITNVAAQMIEP
jgi:hypothetical protein